MLNLDRKKLASDGPLKSGNPKKIYIISFVVGLVFALIQFADVIENYNTSTGMLEGSAQGLLYISAALVCIIFCVIYALLPSSGFNNQIGNKSDFVVFFSSICMLLGLYSGLNSLTGKSSAVVNLPYTLSVVFVILGSVYFGIITLRLGDTKNGYKALTVSGLVLILHFVCKVLWMYFNISVSFNSQVWNLNNFSVIFLMLYFVGEVRYWINRPIPKLYYSLASIATVSGLMSASAQLPIMLNSGAELSDFAYIGFRLVCVLYIAARAVF